MDSFLAPIHENYMISGSGRGNRCLRSANALTPAGRTGTPTEQQSELSDGPAPVLQKTVLDCESKP